MRYNIHLITNETVLDSAANSRQAGFNKMERHPDSQHAAMDALKGYVKQLDIKTLQHFLEQASESREGEASRHYAISLYSEVAKVHRHEVVPYIPRIMSSIVRSLPSSGGCQYLQQACAKVLTSVAMYTADPAKSPGSNDEVLRSLCLPLLPALSSKLEPLAVGAAVCLQALVESENWKLASVGLQDLLCAKGTSAVVETGSVAHMQLMRILAKFSGGSVQRYGAQLLRAGVAILQAASGMMPRLWQQLVAAAELLGSVLKIADSETLTQELLPSIEILEVYRHDKVARVRAAVVEALKVAKTVGVEKGLKHKTSYEDAFPNGARGLRSKMLIRRKNSKEGSDMQDFSVLSVNPGTDFGTPSHGIVSSTIPSTVSFTMRPKRSPLLPVKQLPPKHSLTPCRSSGAFRSAKFDKENAPAKKLRAVFPELPASSRPQGGLRGSPVEQRSKPSHQEIKGLKNHHEDSDMFGASNSFALSPTHPDANSLRGNSENAFVFGASNSFTISSFDAEIEDRAGHSATTVVRDSAPRKDISIGNQFGMITPGKSNLSLEGFCKSVSNSDKARVSEIIMERKQDTPYDFCSTMGCNNISGKADCEGDEIFGEFGNDLIGATTSGSSRLPEDVLCNGCTDVLLTPGNKRTGTRANTVNSESETPIQIAKNLSEDLVLTTPRRLVHCLQAGSVSSPSTGSTPSEENMKAFKGLDDETLSETGWITSDGPVSDSDSIRRDANRGMQSGDSLSLDEVDSGFLSAAPEKLNLQTAGSCRCLSVEQDSINLSYGSADGMIEKMQLIHSNDSAGRNITDSPVQSGMKVSLDLEWKGGKTKWSVIPKLLKKAQGLTGVIVCAFVFSSAAAITVIGYLSCRQDLHVGVPT